MRAMGLSRSSRSFVAVVTAFVLLLCQTAFAAQACAHMPVPEQPQSAAAAPCHDAAAESSAPAQQQIPEQSSVCEAANGLPDTGKIPVFELTDLPAAVVTYEPYAVPVYIGHRLQKVQAVCHSPPLSILHCRFLN